MMINIVSGNTVIEGKGIQIKKNGEYIKIKGKAKLRCFYYKKCQLINIILVFILFASFSQLVCAKTNNNSQN